MLLPVEKAKLEEAFSEAEASLLLEGLTPTENFFAEKARVLAGEISFDQARENILAFHQEQSSAAA